MRSPSCRASPTAVVGNPSLDQLAAQAKAGDAEALDQLHRCVASFARRLARRCTSQREDREDVASEMHLALLRGLPTYDCGRPFVPWFWAIAYNAARQFHRERVRLPAGSYDTAQLLAKARPVAAVVADRELLEAIAATLTSSEASGFDAFKRGLTYVEFAAEAGIHPAAARARMLRAKTVAKALAAEAAA